MDPMKRTQLIRQRAVAKASLRRMQMFIETDDRKVHDIQVRFEELPKIFDRFDRAQNELELSDDTDHSNERETFEGNTLK
jgi:hypothetical protein